MPKFIVAGAGHGGITAALHLARAGHAVTVYEKKRRDAMGYDWGDYLPNKLLQRNGFSSLAPEYSVTAPNASFCNPKKNCPLHPQQAYSTNLIADRAGLLQHMIAQAEAAGVQFVFEAAAQKPIIENKRVMGIYTEQNGQTQRVMGDMVIDAAGHDSAVRLAMPDAMLPDKTIRGNQLFYAYRAEFNKISGPPAQEFPYHIYLDHMYRPGLSWILVLPDSVDVLVGGLQRPLTQEEIRDALEDLRKTNPLLGSKLLRGGYQGSIPVRRPLAVMVADGYAAVGDSAAMTEPLSGSGIMASVEAGRVLAETILDDASGLYSAKTLWPYQAAHFKSVGYRDSKTDMVKSFLLSMDGREIDVLFERGILNADAIAGNLSMTTQDMLRMVLRNIRYLPLLLKTAKGLRQADAVYNTAKAMPLEYDYDAVMRWAETYKPLP